MSKSTSKPSLSALEPGFSFGGPLDHILPQETLRSFGVLGTPFTEKGSDRYWMLEAIRESLSGVGISNPNPAVGCVIVDSKGQEISRGATAAYPGLHAERVAIQKVKDSKRLEGATAYVTLEPCSHQGNQPPCADLLVSSPIKRIVIARTDLNPLVCGKGIQKLKAAGKTLEVGLFSAEVSAWNFPFFAYQILKRPIVVLKWAQTLDGQLADDSNTSRWITSAAARAYTHWLRQRYDAILIGAGTILADHPKLSVRDCAPPHQNNPLPILLDPKGICLKLDKTNQTLLNTKTFIQERPWIYVTTASALRENRENRLGKNKNLTVLQVPGKNLIQELSELLKSNEISQILGHPLQSLMVEGGPKTITSFLRAGYADLLHVFIAPTLTGGIQNRIQTTQLLKEALKFELVSTSKLGPDIVMEMVSPQVSQAFRPEA